MTAPAIDPTLVRDVYQRARLRVLELAPALSAGQLATVVPATPLWTAAEVLCHLAGASCDMVVGNYEGAPGPSWTQAQVESRRDRTTVQVIDELADLGPRVEAGILSGTIGFPVALDLLSHEHDLRGTFRVDRVADAAAWNFAARAFGRRITARVAEAGLPVLRILAPEAGIDLASGDTPPLATWTTTSYELGRAGTGRRSAAQIAAAGWSGDPSPYLPLFSVFGPLPDADVRD